MNWLCQKQKHNLRCLGGVHWERMGGRICNTEGVESSLQLFSASCCNCFPVSRLVAQPNHSSPTFSSSSDAVLLKTSFFFSFLAAPCGKDLSSPARDWTGHSGKITKSYPLGHQGAHGSIILNPVWKAKSSLSCFSNSHPFHQATFSKFKTVWFIMIFQVKRAPPGHCLIGLCNGRFF